MTKNDFIEILAEELELEDTTLTKETILKSLDEWDSMAVMLVIGLLDDKFGQKVTAKDFESIKSVNDILLLIGEDRFSE